jgi:excisionase family DNA binding protein
MTQRFLTLTDVAEVLNISPNQTRALLKSGELLGVQLGGRGIWRIETAELEAYIQRLYQQSRARAAGGPDGPAD